MLAFTFVYRKVEGKGEAFQSKDGYVLKLNRLTPLQLNVEPPLTTSRPIDPEITPDCLSFSDVSVTLPFALGSPPAVTTPGLPSSASQCVIDENCWKISTPVQEAHSGIFNAAQLAAHGLQVAHCIDVERVKVVHEYDNLAEAGRCDQIRE